MFEGNDLLVDTRKWIGLAAAAFALGMALVDPARQVLADESLKQLTETRDYYYTHPAISADGTRIAFWSEGLAEIYVTDSDGTGLRRLVGGTLRPKGPPTISADGQWIAFAAEDSTAVVYPGWYFGDVYVMRTDGTGLRQLTTSPKTSEEYSLSGARGNPVISGDGTLVVFSSNADFTGRNADRSTELFAVRADGTGLRQLTSFANVSGTNVGDTIVNQETMSPTVDHLGSRVAFLLRDERLRRTEGGADRLALEWSVYAVYADGSSPGKLSVVSRTTDFQESLGQRVAISGDALRVAFAADVNPEGAQQPRFELFTIRTDGTGLRQLTSVPSNQAIYPTFPSLSFDGSRIAFVHLESLLGNPSAVEIFAVNADGSGLTQLTTTPGDPVTRRTGFFGATLSADGSHVAFTSSADLLGRNADANYELYVRRLTSLLPVQGVRNRRVYADLSLNRFSLVAQRDLVVRAFFDTGPGGSAVASRGRLVVDEGTTRETTFNVSGYTARPLGYFTDKPEARQRLEDSLNFSITGAVADTLLISGTHTFKARVEPEGAGGFSPWEETFQATFRQPDTVDIFIIPIRITNTAGALVAPDQALLRSASDLLRATYPVDEHPDKVRNLVLAPLDLDQAPLTIELREALAEQIRARLDAQLLEGHVANPARHNFAAGVAPRTVNGQNPLGQTASGGERVGYTFPSIQGVVVSLDREPAAPNRPLIGSTIAHEIGHTLGLGDEYANGRASPNNPPPATVAEGTSTGNYVLETAGGLDTANRVAVFNRAGAEYFGYMGGGHDQNSWATGVDYAFVYGQVTTDTVGVRATAATSSRFINVSGVITRTGGIRLNPFVVATSPYTFARPSGTQYSLQLKDRSGAVLDTVSFDVQFAEEVRGVGYLTADRVPFSFTVPLPDGMASSVVLSGTTPLITHTISARPPTVTVQAPNGGEILRGRAQVRWQASDPDGDRLAYTVIYSPNGADRYVVATSLTTTALDVDFGQLPAGSRASVIVKATDGFNTGEDASNAPFVAGPWQAFVPVVPNGLLDQRSLVVR